MLHATAMLHAIATLHATATLHAMATPLATQLALALRAQLACRTKAVLAKGTSSLRMHSHHFASKCGTGTGRMTKTTRTSF